ncbi:hypothetical protein ASU33_17300 [Solirubrum puertoriconensis]|uniref:Uncharacterized protein n=2 Tax=Solirubrum puertoriconensis TaxID=1751427 RepID=A0A9X0HNU3_SOLP1|nr:hypothetical protein ASU33_17300 [Solirubrum puertoriconensis]
MDEPGEHHLLLTTTDEDSSALQIEVRWFDDWASWGIYPDDQFELLLSAGSSKKEFGKEVLRVLTKIWLQHGEEGYRKKWLRHSFPSQQHTQLQRLLNA